MVGFSYTARRVEYSIFRWVRLSLARLGWSLAWPGFASSWLGSAWLGSDSGSGSGLGLGSARARAWAWARAYSRLDSAWLGPVPARFRLSQHGSVWLGLARKSVHLLAKINIICKTTRTENSMIASNYANGKFGCGVGLARLCFSSSRLGLGLGPLSSARFGSLGSCLGLGPGSGTAWICSVLKHPARPWFGSQPQFFVFVTRTLLFIGHSHIAPRSYPEAGCYIYIYTSMYSILHPSPVP